MVFLTRLLRAGTVNTAGLEHVARLLKTSVVKHVLVVTGAGISTPSGLPDFRGDDTGIYNDPLLTYLMAEHKFHSPSDFFDTVAFKKQPEAFFSLAAQLYPGKYLPNAAHFFVQTIAHHRQLLRWYTQNIDVLERDTGIDPGLLIEAHGTFASAKCNACGQVYDGHEIEPTVRKGRVPKCRVCDRDGVIKPDIVFFGENMPPSFLKHVEDAANCDLCIVMGTGLQVYPFAQVVDRVPGNVTKLVINNTIPPQFYGKNDYVYKGDIIEGVTKLVELCGWENSLDLITKHALKNIEKHRKYIHMRRYVNQT